MDGAVRSSNRGRVVECEALAATGDGNTGGGTVQDAGVRWGMRRRPRHGSREGTQEARS